MGPYLGKNIRTTIQRPRALLRLLSGSTFGLSTLLPHPPCGPNPFSPRLLPPSFIDRDELPAPAYKPNNHSLTAFILSCYRRRCDFWFMDYPAYSSYTPTARGTTPPHLYLEIARRLVRLDVMDDDQRKRVVEILSQDRYQNLPELPLLFALFHQTKPNAPNWGQFHAQWYQTLVTAAMPKKWGLPSSYPAGDEKRAHTTHSP